MISKKIVLAVGGTGGHIFPSVALARHLKNRGMGDQVCIFGASGGAEEKVALEQQIAFKSVPVVKLPGRKISPAMLRVPLALANSIAAAGRALKAADAGVVVGYGSYVSFPTVAAAWRRGIPFYLCEQNTAMGKSNRLMARKARGIFTSYENTEGAPADRVIVVGNPTRFEDAPPPDRAMAREKLGLDPGRETLLIFGGSQGAMSINRAVTAFARARADHAGLQLLHITGPKNFDAITKDYGGLLQSGDGLLVRLVPYLNEMDLAYAAADLTVCRAGATTIAELMALGAPALLIPFPFAAEKHQDKNAKFLCGRDAAVMMFDNELTETRFAETVESLLEDKPRLRRMAENCRKLHRPAAAAAMTEHLLKCI